MLGYLSIESDMFTVVETTSSRAASGRAPKAERETCKGSREFIERASKAGMFMNLKQDNRETTAEMDTRSHLSSTNIFPTAGF